MAETESRQIKKEYISDRIRESIDVFGSQPERLGTILMSAVAVLALSKEMVIRMCRSFIVLTTNPIVPILLIGNKRLNGRKIMEKMHKGMKQEVYTSSCKIIKKKI